MKATPLSLLVGIAVITLSFAIAPQVHAQTNQGVEIKPGIIEDKVNPGDTYRFSLSVKNLFSNTQTFFVEKEDITGLDEQGKPEFAGPGQATGYELTSWITSSKESITLESGEKQTVAFLVRVPKEATPGSHFGGVFFTARASKTTTTGAGIGLQVGAVISLRISGDITEDARLREFSTERLVYDSPQVGFKVRVEDLGNVLLRPHGVIDITDMRGKSVTSVRVNDSAAPVFPGTDRIYSPAWNSDSFAIGRYQAVLSLVYGDDSRKTISSVTSFWVLPMKPILGVLGSLVALIVILYVMVRIYIRKKLKEMGITSGKGGDAAYYEKKYNKSAARMVILISVIFLFCLASLAALFLMFA